MRTESGLIIHRADLDQGGFYIELRIPAEHDGEERAFARIQRDENGRWNWRNDTYSPDITYVINVVDRRYAESRQRAEQEERLQQQQRDRTNESFAPDWEKLVANYGGDDDTAV